MMEEEEDTLFDQEGLLGHKEEAKPERKERKHQIVKTATLSMSFFCLGLCIAIPGPTLIDLGRQVNYGTEHMTFIFTARSIGYLIGALAGGILFDFCNQQLLLFYTISAAAVATVMVPWATSLVALSVFICVHGVALGVLDTGGNVYCIKIWGQKSAPFMQILHFAFGIGAFLAPLIARPFLMDMTLMSDNITSTNDYHPVNFKIPSLDRYNRAVKDVYYIQFMGRSYVQVPNKLDVPSIWLENYTWNHNGDEYLKSDVVLNPKHKEIFAHSDSKLLNTKKYLLNSVEELDQYGLKKEFVSSATSGETGFVHFRGKRQVTNTLGIGVNVFNDNQTELSSAATTTPTSSSLSPIIDQPKKPLFNNGEELSKNHADAAEIDSKLKDLKKNPPVYNVQSQYVTTTTTVPESDVNITSITNEQFNQSVGTNGVLITDIFTPTNKAISNATEASTPSTSAKITTTEFTTTKTTSTTTTTVPSTTTVYSTPTTTKLNPTIFKPRFPPTQTATNPTKSESSKPNFDFSGNSSEFPSLTTNIENTIFTTDSNEGQLLANYSNMKEDIFNSIITTFTGMSKIQFAYIVIGLLLIANSSLYLFIHCKERLLSQIPVIHSHVDLMRPPDTKCFVSTLVILLFFFFFSYMGTEVTFGGLLTTFAVYYPSHFWTSSEAAMLTALFWGSIALGRCFAIVIARFFKPPCMMVTNFCLTFLGAMLLTFTLHTTPVMLWVGTVMLGLGMSSLFPTAISWTNSYYPLTGRATAVFVAGSGIGEMVIPVLTGYLFDNVNHMAIMYMTLVLSTLMILLFLGLQLLVLGKNRPRSRSHSGFMRLNNSEDFADALDMNTVDFAEQRIVDIAECSHRNRIQEVEVDDKENKKQANGNSYKTTEFTKLVELSD